MERNRIILVTVLVVLTVAATSVLSLSLLSPRTRPEAPLIPDPPFVPRSPLYSQAQGSGELVNTISVSGSGKAKMDPDVAVVTIEIMSEADTAERATREAAGIFDTLINSLGRAAIAKDDVRSIAFNLNPIFFYPRDQPPQIKGYRISHSLTVTVASPNLEELGMRAGEVVDIATGAGVTRVTGIRFTVSEESMRALRNEALRNAIRDGREKAEVISDALEVSLVGVGSVSESIFTPGPVFADFARAEVEAAPLPPTQVLPGEFEVSVNVFIRYVIGS